MMTPGPPVMPISPLVEYEEDSNKLGEEPVSSFDDDTGLPMSMLSEFLKYRRGLSAAGVRFPELRVSRVSLGALVRAGGDEEEAL